jgi:DNA-directed RNA polymerase specialized sigma subunit
MTITDNNTSGVRGGIKTEAKEYLQQLRRLDIQIMQMKDQQEMLRATLLSATNPEDEHVSGGRLPGDTSVVNLVDKLDRQSREINRLLAEFIEQRLRIIQEIHSLENPLHVQILFKRYVEYKKLDQIAEEMHYSYVHIIRLHGQALKSFSELDTH